MLQHHQFVLFFLPRDAAAFACPIESHILFLYSEKSPHGKSSSSCFILLVNSSTAAATSVSFVLPKSRRVPVVIRYSADSGMKPYFLTVAKKLKDSHPDIILDKVILPKIMPTGDGKPEISPTFEVMVDGKVIIPTVGKKDRIGSGGSAGKIVFVSMEELDTAISRARRRRRPSTVYGDDEGNARLEILKAKAAAKFAQSFE